MIIRTASVFYHIYVFCFYFYMTIWNISGGGSACLSQSGSSLSTHHQHLSQNHEKKIIFNPVEVNRRSAYTGKCYNNVWEINKIMSICLISRRFRAISSSWWTNSNEMLHNCTYLTIYLFLHFRGSGASLAILQKSALFSIFIELCNLNKKAFIMNPQWKKLINHILIFSLE